MRPRKTSVSSFLGEGRRTLTVAPAVVLLMLLGAATGDTGASERALSFAVAVASGVDSNPLRLASGAESSPYGDIRLAAGAKTRVRSRLELFVSGDATGRVHESGAAGADAYLASARSGLAFTAHRRGSTRLAVLVGARAAVQRLTLMDRATGEVYEVPERSASPSPAMRPVPDRFDANVTGSFVELRWAASRRLSFSLEVDRENRNHVKDYSEETFLHPLDSRARTVSPSARLRVGEIVQLELELDWSDRRYEAMPAVDATGSEVPGTRRRDRYLGANFSVHVDPDEKWDLDLGVQGGDRDDPYAGYFDSLQRGVFVAAARTLSERNRVQVFASRQDLDYGTARVADDPNAALRASETQRGVARFERTVRPRGAVLFVEGGAQRTDNRDPVYAYEREWLSTGFRFRR